MASGYSVELLTKLVIRELEIHIAFNLRLVDGGDGVTGNVDEDDALQNFSVC